MRNSWRATRNPPARYTATWLEQGQIATWTFEADSIDEARKVVLDIIGQRKNERGTWVDPEVTREKKR